MKLVSWVSTCDELNMKILGWVLGSDEIFEDEMKLLVWFWTCDEVGELSMNMRWSRWVEYEHVTNSVSWVWRCDEVVELSLKMWWRWWVKKHVMELVSRVMLMSLIWEFDIMSKTYHLAVSVCPSLSQAVLNCLSLAEGQTYFILLLSMFHAQSLVVWTMFHESLSSTEKVIKRSFTTSLHDTLNHVGTQSVFRSPGPSQWSSRSVCCHWA